MDRHNIDLHSAFRQLPPPRAPQTLLPRVMLAVQAWIERPWYQRAWFTWPLAGQVASVAALLIFVAGIFFVLPAAETTALRYLVEGVNRLPLGIPAALGRTALTLDALRILWRTFVAPAFPYVFTISMLMCIACAAFGTALNRVALGRA